jgi:PAS domain S-box-containing protein
MKSKPVILAVDDQSQNIDLLEAYLIPQGYEIIKAASGQEALGILSSIGIDLVLLDVMMPGMSGFEVMQKIRADEKTRLIPVVMITTLKEANDRIKAFEAGCNDFISKPLNKQELIVRVDSLLKMRYLHNEVEEASEFAENVINTVREPLIALDQGLRVVKVSRSFYDFFKVKPEETVGQLVYDLGNKQWDIPKLRELLETILPQKATFDNYEVEHDFAGVGRRIMLLNARQIERAFGKEKIILLAIDDITEKKEIERAMVKAKDAAEAANKELGAFSYSVSHDLRAPLRHISGYVELLTKHCKSALTAKGVHYLNSIADSAIQMDKLIDDLLQFSRTGWAEMRKSQLDMNSIVKEVAESLSKDNPERAIEWVIGNFPSVYGDEATVRLVWVNLLSNAVKFTRTREKARIEIGAKVETRVVIFYVQDNGAGFDMKYAKNLFGVFQRLHSTEEFEGTGIGLANVQRIVLRHGGRAWAEAELNKGATFYFSMPQN